MNPKTAKVTSKGQITIPLEVRRGLGLETGDRVEFLVEDGRTMMCKERPRTNPFEAYIGALPAFRGRSAINDWIAGMRDVSTRRK